MAIVQLICAFVFASGKSVFSHDADYMSLVVRKPAFCICENKDADQLRGNREADQHLCFRYLDSTIPLLPKFQASSHLLWLYSPVCVGPGRKPRRPVFSQRGSYVVCTACITPALALHCVLMFLPGNCKGRVFFSSVLFTLLQKN